MQAVTQGALDASMFSKICSFFWGSALSESFHSLNQHRPKSRATFIVGVDKPKAKHQRSHKYAMNENVYNLIPPEERGYEKAPMHTSKFNASTKGATFGVPPSYSTFHSRKEDLNRGDETTASRLFKKPAANMGRVVGPDIDPKNFMAAHSKNPPLPPVKKMDRPLVQPLKPSVPTVDDKPVMGLRSDKNFITANAVEAICTQPRRKQPAPELAVHRSTFGRVPKYLESIKQGLREEKEWMETHQTRRRQEEADARAQYLHEMNEDERLELLQKLRELQVEKTRALQSMPFGRDSLSQKARKDTLDRELQQVEDAMGKLSKEVVFVYRDDPAHKNWLKSTAQAEAESTALARRSGRF